MQALLTVVVCIVLVIPIDWVAVSRAGDFATSFDYRYWPLSKLRIGSLILVAAAAAIVVLAQPPDPQNPLDGPLALVIVALVIWALVAWLDFMRQRRAGYREEARYGDMDD